MGEIFSKLNKICKVFNTCFVTTESANIKGKKYDSTVIPKAQGF